MRFAALIMCLAAAVVPSAEACEMDGQASIGGGVRELLCPAADHKIIDIFRMSLLSGGPHPDLAQVAMALNGVERGVRDRKVDQRQFAAMERTLTENGNLRTVLRAALVEASFSAEDRRLWCESTGGLRTQFSDDEAATVARVTQVVECALS